MLLILFVCYIVIASVCDEKSDGYYCDNGVLTKCEFGDIIFQVSCALGCNDTSPLTTTCKGTSSCIYGYPGSFCEHSKLSDNSFKSSITVCHRNGLQQQFQCLNDCEQVTNSFARCKPTQNCYGVETTSKTLGYCPTPTNPIHENVKFNFPLSDALVRELHNELQLISPRCSFMGYLTSCKIVFRECTEQDFFTRQSQGECKSSCESFNQCVEFNGGSKIINCHALCGVKSYGKWIIIIIMLFIL